MLGQDPAGVYSRMDSPTRDRYRHVIERISKRARIPESDVTTRNIKRFLITADGGGSCGYRLRLWKHQLQP